MAPALEAEAPSGVTQIATGFVWEPMRERISFVVEINPPGVFILMRMRLPSGILLN